MAKNSVLRARRTLVAAALAVLCTSFVTGWADQRPCGERLPSEFAQLPSGSPMTDENRAELDGGKIFVHLEALRGTPVKRATAIALVEAPPEEVFSVLMDYEAYPSFMPYCKEVEVQKRTEDEARVWFLLDFPWPVGDRHYALVLKDGREEAAGQEVLTRRWTYVRDSGNINDTYGSWEIFEYDEGRSFVRYTVFTDPGGKMPAWARNMATEIAVPNVIKGLRSRVNEQIGP